MAGIDTQTLYSWLRRGAREKERRRQWDEDVRRRRNAGKRRGRKLSDDEKRSRRAKLEEHKGIKRKEDAYVVFHTKVEEAMANAELGDLANISKAAQGFSSEAYF